MIRIGRNEHRADALPLQLLVNKHADLVGGHRGRAVIRDCQRFAFNGDALFVVAV